MSKLSTFLSVFASEMARLDVAAMRPGVLAEFNPKTASAMLTEWEDAFGLTDHTGTDAQRQARLTAYVGAVGGQSADYFYGIAENLGYNRYPSTTDPHIQILEGQYHPFRLGFSHIGIDKLWDGTSGHSLWTWTVQGTGVETDTTLQAYFNLFKPAHTTIVFTNA
jgi:uncharacterized protein YmfQ (DUF2313 family)